MKNTKYLPLALFTMFCLKALITGLNLETVACLGTLGAISFLYELFIQNTAIKKFQDELKVIKVQDELSKKELEQIKAYVSSLKLNGIRGAVNGFNKPA